MWRRNVKLYYLWSFLSSFMFLSAILVPFFRERGLDQFGIQSLQAFFQVAVFLLEVPTGVVADEWGRKQSLVLGSLFSTMGLVLYALGTNFGWFLGCEFLLALGVALKSGANQALLYDSLKEEGEEGRFGEIVSRARGVSLVAIGLGAVFGSWMTKTLSLSQVVVLNGLALFLAVEISLMFKEPEVKEEDGEVKRWLMVLREGWRVVRGNVQVRWLIIEGAWLYGLGYFVIWLYQVRLVELGVKVEYFGWFHALLIGLQVGWLAVWGRVWDWIGWRRLLMGLPVLVGLGYWVVEINSWWGVVGWFGLTGVFGLTSREVLSVLLQKQVRSKVRATVASFAGMIRSLVVAVLNPLVGRLVDWNLEMTFLILGGLGLVGFWIGKRTAEMVEKGEK